MNNRLIITGAHGMLGWAVQNRFKKDFELFCPTKNELNLEKEKEVYEYFMDIMPGGVIHLAAKVGGVLDNIKHPVDFFEKNVRININVLRSSFEACADKVISVMSTCVYPNNANIPLIESDMHGGSPHFSNYGYAYAKRMLDIQSKAYRDQYGRNFITVIPNNIYGINDFYGDGCHVIPALMKRIHMAKSLDLPYVIIWGTGKCLREFTLSDDIAECISNVYDLYNEDEPINIGNPSEISIKELVGKLVNIIGYKGEIKWDLSKPEGQFRKPSNIQKYKKIVEYKRKVIFNDIDDGLRKTYEWFEKKYPNVRGVLL